MVQLKWFGGLALTAALVLVANSADARHYHSHGSYGSCGSSGGSYGSWGSHGSSGGSWGSHGSSGGSWGSHGSSGSYGSYGSSGSSGSYGSGGGVPVTASADVAPATAVAEAVDHALVRLNVPADAIVYMSNQRMTLDGTSREFIVPGLKAGKQYRYPVRVEVVRDGKLVTASSEERIHAGQELSLAFAQNADQPVIVGMRD